MKNRINYVFLVGFSFLSNCFGNVDYVSVEENIKENASCIEHEFLSNKELRDNFYNGDEVFFNFCHVTDLLRYIMEYEYSTKKGVDIGTNLPVISENNISDNLFDNFIYLFSRCEIEPFSILCKEDFIEDKNLGYKEDILKKFFKLSDNDADNTLKRLQNAPLQVDGYFASDLRNVFSKNTISACRIFALQEIIISNWISIYKAAYLEAVRFGLDSNKKVDEKTIDGIIDCNCDIVEKQLEEDLNKLYPEFLKHFRVRDFVPYMENLDTGVGYIIGGKLLSK